MIIFFIRFILNCNRVQFFGLDVAIMHNTCLLRNIHYMRFFSHYILIYQNIRNNERSFAKML